MTKELNEHQLAKGWEIQMLGDVCSFYNGKAHEKSIDENGKYKVVNSKFVSSEGKKAKRTPIAQFPLFKEDIVMVMSDVPNGKTLAKCFFIDEDDSYSLNQRVCAFRTTNFDKHFLFYQLNRNQYFLNFNNGENQSNLRKGDILNCPLLIPPIPQQKQIVAILDKAFEDLDTAKANAELNLRNARELFDSYLQNVFENKGDDWEEAKWIEILDIRSGRNQKEVLDPKGAYPILGSAGKIMGYANSYLCEENTTIIGRKGTINNPLFITTKFWNVDTAFGLHAGEKLTSKFLYYFCKSFDFTEMDKGSGRPSLVKTDLLQIKMSFPSISTQEEIINKIDAFHSETKKLEAIYTQKIADLEEMKKSVLQKAFSGQLNTIK